MVKQEPPPGKLLLRFFEYNLSQIELRQVTSESLQDQQMHDLSQLKFVSVISGSQRDQLRVINADILD